MGRLCVAANNDYIVTGTTLTPTTNRSVSFWINITSYGNTTTGRVYNWRDVAGSNEDLNIFDNPGHIIDLSVSWSTAGGEWTAVGPSTGSWHHIGWTYNGSSTSNDVIFYVDGVAVSTTRLVAPSGTLNAFNVKTTFGQRYAGSGNKLDGGLAEFARWTDIRSAGDMATLATKVPANHISPGTQIMYYKFPGVDSPEKDYASSDTATVTGTSYVLHPFSPFPERMAVRQFSGMSQVMGG